MVSTEGLGPMTRDIFADYYDGLPFNPPLSEDVLRISSEIKSMANDFLDLLKETTALQDLQGLTEDFTFTGDPCYEMEPNLWKNREHIQEILSLIGDPSCRPLTLRPPENSNFAALLTKMAELFRDSNKSLVAFQDLISESVFSTVTLRLPHVTRRLVTNKLKELRTIAKAKLDGLVTSGTTIGAQNALLREYVMDRRKHLAQACNFVCRARTSKEHNAVIPNDVLSSLRTINDDYWPLEEQKEHYGEALHSLTVMILSIRFFLSLLSRSCEASELKQDQTDILGQAAYVYTCELRRFTDFLSKVFTGSPFFKCYDFEEINAAAGETHEVVEKVHAAESEITWDFRLILPVLPPCKVDLDIEFMVEFRDALGNKRNVLPKKLCGADKGSFVAPEAGICRFIWDNSYSSLLTKYIHYRVLCTAPAVTEEETATETTM